MTAQGIHAHPTRKLGRAPEDPSKPRLRLSQFVSLPAVPPSEDYEDIGVDWDMFGNDSFGDCGPAEVAHSRMQVSKYLTGKVDKPSLDDVYDLYRRSGNPNFDPKTGADDNGVVMQDMFNAARKGGIAGVKPVAFARVDQTNEHELAAAVAIFGGLHWGVTLEVAQQSQTDHGLWDYRPGTGVWGGHAVYQDAYSAKGGKVVTWGEEVEFTEAFAQHQLDEAWVVIWPEHLQSRAFLEGVDLDALAQAYHDLTGEDLPVPPSPSPPPLPGAPSLDAVAAGLADQLASLTGEPSKHLRDRRHEGRVVERFYVSGGFEIGVMDKR